MSRQSFSIVKYYPEQEKGRCGYCKSPDTNCSYGMWAQRLTVEDYQALLDRGWRRSGCYCYKPLMDQTCCPTYTIKCEALQFKITKSQKKILKKMGRFLRNELNKDDTMDTSEDDDVRDIGEFPNYSKHLRETEDCGFEMDVKSVNEEVNNKVQPDVSENEKQCNDPDTQQKHSESLPCALSRKEDSHDISQSVESVEMNSVRAPCKKAKLLRIERKQKKLLAQGKTQDEIDAMFKENKQQNRAKSLEELFEEMLSGTKRLEIKLVKVMTNEFKRTFDESANLYKKYQMAIHGDPPEECEKKSFFNFLAKNSLQQWKPSNGPPTGYGTFHEQYWLDNELIAVGVIDILPACISSVYFFYDPAYAHLSLGTFSSLREVCLTRELNRSAENLKYYYMGFYIHTCPKMRYKTRMKPSKLLCPETYRWFDVEPCLRKLDKEKYSRLNDDIDAIDEDGVINVNEVCIIHAKVKMTFRAFKILIKPTVTKEEEEEVEEYARSVGMKCARSMYLYRR
ncbi:arginyl-tRNA--protein transferase 1 isoform X2 [Colletes gigas]|uniref:arginyl-tRNA--protein transferase 1 isoform X2 n=1 Tax=Colletes gigas TaxID=935657 RepID=UPI001C9AC087|nr:arginyl-tRNA--protein transferase 1 isoform X2 [Colletes gigas]